MLVSGKTNWALPCVPFKRNKPMPQADSIPTIEDVVNSEMDQTTAPLEVTESQETTAETEPTAGQPAEQQPEESFTAFNPNDLPPEMQEVYKRWQGDYTKKRQAEKAEIKALQAELETLKGQGQTPQQMNQSYQDARQQGQIDPKMSLQEYTEMVIAEAEKRIETKEENAYIETSEAAFFNLDPRFAEGPGQDKILLNHVAAELGAMRDAYETEHNGSVRGFDFTGNAKKLIEEYDQRIASYNKAFLDKQNTMAKANADKFAKASPKAVTGSKGKPSGKMSIDEAFDAAFDELHA